MALPALAIGGQMLGHIYEKYQSGKANERYRNFFISVNRSLKDDLTSSITKTP